MIPELSIIRLCCDYAEWSGIADRLATTDLPRELQNVYRVLDSHHKSNEQGVNLTVSDLANLFFATRPRDAEFYQTVFTQLDKLDASKETTYKLLASIQTNKLLRDLSISAYESSEGRTDLEKVMQQIEALRSLNAVDPNIGTSSNFEFVTDDLEVLVNESISKPGLRWRLQTINRMLGSLRQGDFGFIFARPETGKTTFLASEVTHMANQTERPILWLSNEEQGNKVMLRCYQAALGVDLTTLLRDLPNNKKRYHELTKGNIRIYDSGNIHRKQVEQLCATLKPSLVVYDQIDKIKGFDNDREDLRLGSIYQWARELAKEYAPAIGVCQADGSGEGQKWLTMANVSNAKTSKQAEADWILGIGKVNEPGYDQLRYLHASKNKLAGDEDTNSELRHGRCEVLIDAERARYVDIQ